jgi:NAD(P)-dependent dehydrogenase (short-subunit alcohol dehydrogenase family)
VLPDIGHALLTQLLLPKMLDTRQQHPEADLRIHVTSSTGGLIFTPSTGLDLPAMSQPAAISHPMTRYGHSKLANMLFARKLAELYPFISTTSSHPGTVKSEIWGKANGARILGWFLAPIVWMTGVTIDEGAKTQLWCATAPRGELQNGKFYQPIGRLDDKGKHQTNAALADELWEWTERELAKHEGPGWPRA